VKQLTKHAHEVLVNLVQLNDGRSFYWRYNGRGRQALEKLIKLGLVDEVGVETLVVTDAGRAYVREHGEER
jgi:hypothetical protein